MYLKKCSVSPFSDSYKSIVEFIDAQFEAYLQEELKIKRTLHSYHDTRIHACLYFIAPTGHSLKSLDLVTMKKLDSKVSFSSQHQTVIIIQLKLFLCLKVFSKFFSSVCFPAVPDQFQLVSGYNIVSFNIKASCSLFSVVRDSQIYQPCFFYF